MNDTVALLYRLAELHHYHLPTHREKRLSIVVAAGEREMGESSFLLRDPRRQNPYSSLSSFRRVFTAIFSLDLVSTLLSKYTGLKVA